jgi:hypothetical protein
MKINYFIIIIIILLSCCSNNKEKSDINLSSKRKINFILIQFNPALKPHSLIILDLNNSELLFQHLGLKKGINEKYEVFDSPKPLNIKLNKKEVSLISDTLLNNFTLNDLKDHLKFIKNDYASVNMLFVFNDGTTKDIDLINYLTINQYKLLDFIFSKMVQCNSDNEREMYLADLHKLIKLIFTNNNKK